MTLAAQLIGYGSRFIKGAATRVPRVVAIIVFTAVPFSEIVKFSLKGTALSGLRYASMKPMSVASINIFVPIPHLHQRVTNKKIKKFAHPKMATVLVGDIPGFIPPGKIPFMTHIWRQAQKVPIMPINEFPTAAPRSGLTVKTNKQMIRGIIPWIWLGKGFRIASIQTTEPRMHIQTAVRTENWRATAKFEP